MKLTKVLNLLIAITLLGITLTACGPDTVEARLYGEWKNKREHTYVFREGGSAMWIYPVGEKTDTFFMEYRIDDTQTPIALDFYNFENGPMKGKTLYGVAEFVEDDRGEAVRLNFRAGDDESVRPEDTGEGGARLYVRL